MSRQHPTQYDMLTQLVSLLEFETVDVGEAYRLLRAGVDYTQNCGDGSIGEDVWTAARNAAKAFEALQQALCRLRAVTTEIPF